MEYQRKSNLYYPKSKEPFTLSRSKIELFTQCPRCFYMDVRLGIGRPSTPPYTLNSAVDSLLKNEFDLLRKSNKKHLLMEKYNIDALPYDHPLLPQWRGEVKRFVGALAPDPETNLIINGLVDDIWINSKSELHIVDYKSTSSDKEVTLDDEYKQAYKRQMEVYQWVFRTLGFSVSDRGYFVYANARKNLPQFDGRLEFEMSILEYRGNCNWVNSTLKDIKSTLDKSDIPPQASDCDYCAYRKSSVKAVQNIKAV